MSRHKGTWFRMIGLVLLNVAGALLHWPWYYTSMIFVSMLLIAQGNVEDGPML